MISKKKPLILDLFKRLDEKPYQYVEVFYSFYDSQKINIRNKKITDTKKSLDEGYSIRIIDKGKTGFAYSTDFSDEGIKHTIAKSEGVLKFSSQDKDNIPPSYKKNPSTTSLEDYDPQILSLSIDKKIEMAMHIEEIAYKTHPTIKNTEEIGLSTGVEESIMISSTIPIIENSSTYIGGFAEVIAQKEDQKEAGSFMMYTSNLEDFSVEKIGREAATRASILIDAGEITSRETTLVLDPSVSSQFISVLASLFSAEQVFKGKSLLKDKIGQSISVPSLTIIDDGMIPRELGSSYYDDEGVPTQKTTVVENGVLKSYLFDTKNALRFNTSSTGNASRGSYKGQPYISPSNMYVVPGKEETTKHISQIKDGLFIFEVMGLHTVNPISGDFSLGAQGVIINNGKKTDAIKNIMIAGNLIDFLKKISFIGSDLEFFLHGGNIGAPTIGVSNIMVSG